MSKYVPGDRVVARVSTPNSLTKGKAYTVTQTGTTFTRILDDKGVEFRQRHDNFEYYFEPLELTHLPESLRHSASLSDIGYRRLQQPACTCGAWIAKDHGHTQWCDEKYNF